MKYLHDRRKALGGYVPARNTKPVILETPPLSEYAEFLEYTKRDALLYCVGPLHKWNPPRTATYRLSHSCVNSFTVAGPLPAK